MYPFCMAKVYRTKGKCATECATLVSTSAIESLRRSGRVVECGGLENRLARKGHGGSNPSSSASKLKTTLKLRRFFFRSKRANVNIFYHSFIPTVSKTVRPERAAVWKTSFLSES